MSGLIETNMNRMMETKMKTKKVAEDECSGLQGASMIKLKAETVREGGREVAHHISIKGEFRK